MKRKSAHEFLELADKVMLLIDPESVVYQGFHGNSAQKKKTWCKDVYGIGEDALRGWIRGRRKIWPRGRVLKRICTGAKRWAKVPLTPEDFSDSVDKYAFGEKLGFAWSEVQRIIDRHVHVGRVRPGGFVMSAHQADALFAGYGGVYHAYHYAPHSSQNELCLVRSSLRIRHVVTGEHGSAVVACKLHITKPTGGQSKVDYYPYEGLVKETRDPALLYFSFDEHSLRSNGARDMANIVIDARSLDGRSRSMRGMVSSVSADGQIYSAAMMLHKQLGIRESLDREAVKDVMRNKLGFIDHPAAIQREIRENPWLAGLSSAVFLV